jgi:hypothetical protein
MKSPTVIFLRRLDFAVQATGGLDGTKRSKVAEALLRRKLVARKRSVSGRLEQKTQSLSAAILCLEGSTQEGYYGLIYWSIDKI